MLWLDNLTGDRLYNSEFGFIFVLLLDGVRFGVRLFRGVAKENRFLCGVEGVRVGPAKSGLPVVGGVCARDEPGKACGTVSSKSSVRSNDAKVWFAWSTRWKLSSECEARCDLDGVAGVPSSCSSW